MWKESVISFRHCPWCWVSREPPMYPRPPHPPVVESTWTLLGNVVSRYLREAKLALQFLTEQDWVFQEEREKGGGGERRLLGRIESSSYTWELSIVEHWGHDVSGTHLPFFFFLFYVLSLSLAFIKMWLPIPTRICTNNRLTYLYSPC